MMLVVCAMLTHALTTCNMLHYLSIVQLTAYKDTTGMCLLNVLTVYAPHLGKLQEDKESSLNELFHLVSSILQNEMVVVAGDMNGHVGSNNVDYDAMHGGYRYGARNADGSRILEFADGLNLII